ncbi:MAG: hypothetical protein ACR2KE_05680 [Candidatus Nanopelagicales bacterium]
MIRIAIGALAACLAWAGFATAAPAQAAPLAACQWISGEMDTSYECTDFLDPVTSVDIVECWKMPPSPRTYVRYRSTSGWVRSDQITLRVRGGKGCDSTYPYKTIVTVGASLLAEMTATRVRLVMPATTGTLDDSTPYSYGKTIVNYGACLIPEGTVDYCPER